MNTRQDGRNQRKEDEKRGGETPYFRSPFLPNNAFQIQPPRLHPTSKNIVPRTESKNERPIYVRYYLWWGRVGSSSHCRRVHSVGKQPTRVSHPVQHTMLFLYFICSLKGDEAPRKAPGGSHETPGNYQDNRKEHQGSPRRPLETHRTSLNITRRPQGAQATPGGTIGGKGSTAD